MTTLLCLALLAATPAQTCPAGFESMFNGKDLSQWEGEPGWWSVEDGAITGIMTKQKPLKHPTYLFWKGTAGDFELRALYRLDAGNSGINFRSRKLPNWDVFGYQADLEAGKSYTGILYDVHQRAVMTHRGEKVVYNPDGTKQVTRFGDPAELQKHVKPGDWNQYVIIAHGPEIILEINGVVMSHVIDGDAKKAARDGLITLQLHPGPPMKVQYKDLCIKRLGGK